ncbi:MAG: flippase-like domain-containing protein [Bacteroidales bacterium]|nr:flippase-like domain-containing protein [Bacteroidales bacterium]
MGKINKYIKLLLKTAITAGALYLIFSKISFREVIEVISSSNLLYLLYAFLLFVFSKTVAAFRLNNFFRSIEVNLSEAYNFKLYLLGMFYNLFLPGGIGGDGYKIYLLNKKFDVKVKSLFWAAFFDRLSGMLVVFCLAIVFSYFVSYQITYKSLTWILIPVAVYAFYLFMKFIKRDFLKAFTKTTLHSLVVQLSQVLAAYLILRAIGVEDSQPEYLFVFLISSIVYAFPLTIGGMGSRELTFFYGAQLLSLDMDRSIALSLVFYIMTAIMSLSGVYYSFNTSKHFYLTTKSHEVPH